MRERGGNMGGGVGGDGTLLLQALVDAKMENAAVAINDPQAVVTLAACRPGDRMTLDIGGRGILIAGGPLNLNVEFISRSDGRFKLEDSRSHLASMCGSQFDMGPCAVVRHGGLQILLTSRKTPPFDLGQWRSQGIEPEKLAVIGVKAAVAPSPGFYPISAQPFSVWTPRPASKHPVH